MNNVPFFVEGAGIHPDVKPERAAEILNRLKNFAGYGFNKSCGGLCIGCLSRRRNPGDYPVEFMAAIMTGYGEYG